jgi:hypothetical protein
MTEQTDWQWYDVGAVPHWATFGDFIVNVPVYAVSQHAAAVTGRIVVELASTHPLFLATGMKETDATD